VGVGSDVGVAKDTEFDEGVADGAVVGTGAGTKVGPEVRVGVCVIVGSGVAVAADTWLAVGRTWTCSVAWGGLAPQATNKGTMSSKKGTVALAFTPRQMRDTWASTPLNLLV